MKSVFRGLALALALLWGGVASAQSLPRPLSDPLTARETFLAAAIATIIVCGLVSFLLLGRVSERTHVALALLSVLTGGFGLLVLFGGSMYENPIAAIIVLLLLFGLFKLMSQFEANRKQPKK